LINDKINITNLVSLKKESFFWSILKEIDRNYKFSGKTTIKKIYSFIDKKNYYFYHAKKIDHQFTYMINSLKQKDFDVFHPTYYDTYFMKYLGNRPYVLTVYDMIQEIFHEKYPVLNNSIIKQKRELITNAARIIAISEHTKKDIINIYNIKPEKIDVVYLGQSFVLKIMMK
jgi:glycosyltransferase involved in cell wall biosynthesis